MKKLSLWQLRVGILLVIAAFMAVGATAGQVGAAGAKTHSARVGYMSGPMSLSHHRSGSTTAFRGTTNKILTMSSHLVTSSALTLTPTTTSVICTNTHVTGVNTNVSKGKFTEYTIPTANSEPFGIIKGVDGAYWFAEESGNMIGRVTTSGVFTECPLPTSGSKPVDVTRGPDGAIWFTEYNNNAIGRIAITTSGAAQDIASITEFSGIGDGSKPGGIVTGPDGNLWFTDYTNDYVDKVDINGHGTRFGGLTASAKPAKIIVGPDGNLWFTENNKTQIGRITTHGDVLEFGGLMGYPGGITIGPDKNLWFIEETLGDDFVGRLTTQGSLSEFDSLQPQGPGDITNSGDGKLAFTASNDVVGHITTAGIITPITVPTGGAGTGVIVTASKGVVWFTEYDASKIAKLTFK